MNSHEPEGAAPLSDTYPVDAAIIALNNRIASTLDSLPPTASARKSPNLMIHVRIADIETVIGAARDAQIAAHASDAEKNVAVPEPIVSEVWPGVTLTLSGPPSVLTAAHAVENIDWSVTLDADEYRPRSENASSAPRSPHTGFEGARITGASLEREGVGMGHIAVDPDVEAKREQILDTVAEVFDVPRDLLTGQPAADVDALETLAGAASGGRWEVNDEADEITLDKGSALTRWNEDGTVGYPARSWRSIDRLVEIDPEDYTEDEVEAVVADLQYIAAARPEVMLALIERLRRAEARVLRLQNSFASMAGNADWFTAAADKVLERIKTETTEDVMLYHDAVSVLGAVSTWYRVAEIHTQEASA